MACCSRALVGKFAKHKVSSGLGEKLGDALPSAPGILALYDRTKTDLVTATLISAVRSSTAEIDGGAPRTSRPAWPKRRPGWAAADPSSSPGSPSWGDDRRATADQDSQ